MSETTVHKEKQRKKKGNFETLLFLTKTRKSKNKTI